MGGGGFSGGLIGATVGFFVGGPWGAAIGASAGYGGGQGWFGKTAQDVSTLGASAQQRQARKAAAAQEAANKEQARMAATQNRRAMVQQIRAARISRAQNVNRYAQEGGVSSSGTAGALSSIGSQLSSNLGFMQSQQNSMNTIQDYMNSYYYHINKQQEIATKWQSVKDAVRIGANLYTAGAFKGAGFGGGITETSGGTASGFIYG